MIFQMRLNVAYSGLAKGYSIKAEFYRYLTEISKILQKIPQKR